MVGAEVVVILIPSVATFLGCQDGGGQHPMPDNMHQLFRMGDTATYPIVPTAHPMHLIGGGDR